MPRFPCRSLCVEVQPEPSISPSYPHIHAYTNTQTRRWPAHTCLAVCLMSRWIFRVRLPEDSQFTTHQPTTLFAAVPPHGSPPPPARRSCVRLHHSVQPRHPSHRQVQAEPLHTITQTHRRTRSKYTHLKSRCSNAHAYVHPSTNRARQADGQGYKALETPTPLPTHPTRHSRVGSGGEGGFQ